MFMGDSMKVYVVGHHGPEHNVLISIHKTRKGALNAWNKIRLDSDAFVTAAFAQSI